MTVVDASAALAWIVPSQTTPAALALLNRGTPLIAPPVFQIEVRNALLKAERRRLVSGPAADIALTSLAAVIAIVETGAELDDLYALGRHHRLSMFDAFYLDLAIHNSDELASRDRSLLEAARRVGVTTCDLR